MNIQNKGYPSIEQLTDQYLGRPRGIETRENAAGGSSILPRQNKVISS